MSTKYIEKYFKPAVLTKRSHPEISTDPIVETSSAIKGFAQPVSGNEVFQDGKAGERITDRFYTGVSTNAEYGDVITQNGQSYVVVYSIQPAGISGRVHHKEIMMEAK